MAGRFFSTRNSNTTHDAECRSLIVRQTPEGWVILAHSFLRFFNDGESKEDDRTISDNIEHCIIQEKKDGSLITVANIDDKWRVFTRGTDADTNPFRVYFGGRDTFDKVDEKVGKLTFGSKVRKYLDLAKLNRVYTYNLQLARLVRISRTTPTNTFVC